MGNCPRKSTSGGGGTRFYFEKDKTCAIGLKGGGVKSISILFLSLKTIL